MTLKSEKSSGMANFRKRGEHQWQARVRRKGYPAQLKTFDTRVEAEAWARKVESGMDGGTFVSRAEAEATSLSEALDRYEREVVPGKKGDVQEKSVIRMWKATTLVQRSMAGIRSADIAKQRDEWLKTCKPATVLRRIALLSHVFKIARHEWRMESLANPIEFVTKPSPNNARTRRVTTIDAIAGRSAEEGELERVIAASGSAVLPAIIRLAVETAMRRGEIIGLLWENVDIKKRVAHLPETKNGSSRDVPLSSRAIAALEASKPSEDDTTADKKAVKEKSKSSVKTRPAAPLTGFVFAVSSDAVTRAFERAVLRARRSYEADCKKVGRVPDKKYLTDLRFHDLRHEAASRLASIYQLHELAKITGHKDPRMLMRYYHPRAEDLAKRLD
ncbi:MAG: site-specific integrase [Rhodanobacter sp.]